MNPINFNFDFWYGAFLWSTILTVCLFSIAVAYISFRWRALLDRHLPSVSFSMWQEKSAFERVRDLKQLPITMQQVAEQGIAKKQKQFLEFEFGKKIHESLWVLPALMLVHLFSLYALFASSIGSAGFFTANWNPFLMVQNLMANLLEKYGVSILALAFSFSLAAYVLIRLLREASKYTEHYGKWMRLMNEVRGYKQPSPENWLKRVS